MPAQFQSNLQRQRIESLTNCISYLCRNKPMQYGGLCLDCSQEILKQFENTDRKLDQETPLRRSGLDQEILKIKQGRM